MVHFGPNGAEYWYLAECAQEIQKICDTQKTGKNTRKRTRGMRKIRKSSKLRTKGAQKIREIVK